MAEEMLGSGQIGCNDLSEFRDWSCQIAFNQKIRATAMRIMSPNHEPQIRQAVLGLSVLVGTLSLVCAGCYSGDSLVLLARSEAMRTRLSEVQLGHFRTTMPRDIDTGAQASTEFRIYGTAPHYRTEELEAKIDEDGYRLRYAILTAIRQSTPNELADPEFVELRNRLAKVAADFFGETTIDAIGLSMVRVTHY